MSLIKNGFLNVKVFERDETIDQRRQGYGLTILQGINALKKLDVYSEVYDMGIYIFFKFLKLINLNTKTF